MQPTPIFLDLETTINNKGDDAIGDMSASPWHPDNKIVYTGFLIGDARWPEWVGPSGPVHHHVFDAILSGVPKDGVLVAQNIAFDLEYELEAARRDGGIDNILDWLMENSIWDVMLAEYLLSGQQIKWASLDELATIYGGTIKDSRIKEYWKAGICTSDIPQDEIVPYLEQDVLNLRIIYEGQLAAAKRLGMLPLIQSQMDARMATILMEYHGMAFDVKQAVVETKKLQAVKDELEARIKATMHKLLPDVPFDGLKPASRDQLSVCLYGGAVNYVADEQIMDNGEPVRFKTGKRKGEIKTRKVVKSCTSGGLYDPLRHAVPLTGSGAYGTDTETLTALYKASPLAFVEDILAFRDVAKQVSTYFVGYSTLTWPNTGLIHGQLNHCQTNTGRLSSSKPNLQNISNKDTETDE